MTTVAIGIYGPPAWTLHTSHVERLQRQFPDIRFINAGSDDELAEALRDAEISFSSVIRADAFEGATRLKWVHASAAGVGATLFPAFVESDVVLTNSRGVMSEWIAEHVLGVILMWQRGLHISARRQAEGDWAQNEIADWIKPSLKDTRVLIVGAGSIGSAVADICLRNGMPFTTIRRHAGKGEAPPEVLPVELEHHDAVVITVPHTRETHHMFNREMLAKMLPGSLLVNVARGKIIDEAALVEALRQGRPGAAALDVFEHEPLAPDSPLWKMENVILTPHVAGFGHGFWTAMVDLFAANLERWLAGRPLENVVDKRRGY